MSPTNRHPRDPRAIDFADPACRAFPFTPTRIAEAERAVAEGAANVDRFGRAAWRDTECPGLTITVSRRGAVYGFVGRIGGKVVRQSLGPCGVVTLPEARRAATVRRFDDTAAAKLAPRRERPATGGETLQAVWDRYLADAEAGRFVIRRRLRPDTLRSYKGCWGAHLKAHGDRPLGWIASNIDGIFEPIRSTAPYAANRTLALLRILFVYAIRRSAWKGPNPVAEAQARGLTRHAEAPRQRVFTDAERVRFLKACQSAAAPWGQVFRFALETGLRRRALLGLRWADADIEGARLVIPAGLLKSANGGELGIDLTPAAVAVLREVAGGIEGEPEPDRPIFAWGSGRPLTASPYERAFKAVCDAAKLKGLRPHDLRRDVGARLVAAGTPLPIVARILGHSPKSVSMLSRTYAPVSDATARAWMMKATLGAAVRRPRKPAAAAAAK